MNSNRFVQYIVPSLIAFINYLAIYFSFAPILMQDGAGCHWSRETRETLDQYNLIYMQ